MVTDTVYSKKALAARGSGDPEYERVIPSESQQEDLYLSVLTVNRDPGRAIRNFGCLIVCLGIAIMFYMKAYFSKLVRKSLPHSRINS